MKPRISMVALAVSDLDKSIAFYENGLGFPKLPSPPEVAFFNLNGTWLGLSKRDALANDATVSPVGSGYEGFNLAHNVASEAEVERVFAEISRLETSLYQIEEKHPSVELSSLISKLHRVKYPGEEMPHVVSAGWQLEEEKDD